MSFKETIIMVIIILPFVIFAKINQINELPFLFVGFIVAKIVTEYLFKKQNPEKESENQEKEENNN